MSSEKWNINSDIYDIVDSIHNVQKRYIEDEDETTLNLGIFGFITDTEAKKIQTATILAGQLGNEMFATRAKLTKNVLTHAANSGIIDINAKPAKITVTLCVRTEDVKNNIDGSGNFFIDADCPIFIENYEFHLDYDVRITRHFAKNYLGKESYTYTAQYIVVDENGNNIINRLSDITNPYINQPFLLNIGGEEYVGIQCTIRQCTIDEITDTMVADSVIENKTYSFDFTNQLADFRVVVTDMDKIIELIPYMRGSSVDPDVENYCWYIYTSENTIRISFDSSSYIPGLNCDLYIKVYTTLGSNGNFEYLNIDQTSDGLFVDIESTKYGYRPITSYLVAVTDSIDGSDRKTKEELQKLIPKASMSRGSITTETDVLNYFDLINTDSNRLVMDKKVDNQLDRIWYGYFLLKDDVGNIIPTNTIAIKFSVTSPLIKKSKNNRYIIPAGTVIRYDVSNKIGELVDEIKVPFIYDTKEYFNDGYYYYRCMYNTIINLDPLYCSYFMTACNYESYFTYDYVNQDYAVQFIANRFHLERSFLLYSSDYNFEFKIAQATTQDIVPVITRTYLTRKQDDDSKEQVTEVIETQNIRCILVLYKDKVPYRWKECQYNAKKSSENSSIYTFECSMSTDNTFDVGNRLEIRDMREVGGTTNMFGYVDEFTEAKLYVMVLDNDQDQTKRYPRKDIDDIAPGYENYIVTNIYNCAEGINFFENFTNVTDTRITSAAGSNAVFTLSGVPVVGYHYLMTDEQISYLLEAMKERKAYIDYCLHLIENSMNVDFKFFNTYGPSNTYALEDETTLIDHVDLTMKFKLSVKDNTDISIIKNIKQDIKDYVENINKIEDWHAPNLITQITNTYKERINFFEFVGFNVFDADDQHIVKIDIKDPKIVPEFINIRNYYDIYEAAWAPCIDIELV